MDLQTFKKSTQKTTTVLVEYTPDTDALAPKIIIHKIGDSELTITTGLILHRLAKLCHNTARHYVFGVSLNKDQQMTLLSCSEADKLAWFDEQLNQNEVAYAF